MAPGAAVSQGVFWWRSGLVFSVEVVCAAVFGLPGSGVGLAARAWNGGRGPQTVHQWGFTLAPESGVARDKQHLSAVPDLRSAGWGERIRTSNPSLSAVAARVRGRASGRHSSAVGFWRYRCSRRAERGVVLIPEGCARRGPVGGPT
jgi:hypothetical protein